MEVIQRSEEWFKQKYGNASASRISDVIAKTKSGYSASRENYMTQLVLERFGVFEESFTNRSIEWGIETEPLARLEYEANTGNMVTEVGYILHPTIAKSGASPDGKIGDKGLLEIKCPDTKTHFSYLLAGIVPPKYIPQMAWQMACTGAEWVDFISYDPRAPKGLDCFEIRYHRDSEYIAMLESEVKVFLDEVDKQFLRLQKKLEEIKAGKV